MNHFWYIWYEYCLSWSLQSFLKSPKIGHWSKKAKKKHGCHKKAPNDVTIEMLLHCYNFKIVTNENYYICNNWNNCNNTNNRIHSKMETIQIDCYNVTNIETNQTKLLQFVYQDHCDIIGRLFNLIQWVVVHFSSAFNIFWQKKFKFMYKSPHSVSNNAATWFSMETAMPEQK